MVISQRALALSASFFMRGTAEATVKQKDTYCTVEARVFPLFATGVIDTGAACRGVVDTGGKFATVINDTSGIGGKYAAVVVDTGDAS